MGFELVSVVKSCAKVDRSGSRRSRGSSATAWIPRALAALVVALATPVTAYGMERVALVVAAENYDPLPQSRIGQKRGEAVAEALRQQGFEVVVATSPTNATARAKLREFAERADGAEMALAVIMGHGASTGGQTFFLPVNADIARSTDLLSRALSLASIVQITEKAEASGVFFFVTTPAWPAPVPGLDARPGLRGEAGDGHVVVLSSSPSTPISQIDNASIQAADAFVAAASETDATLSSLVAATQDGGRAVVIGSAPDLALVKPEPVPEPEPEPQSAPVVVEPEPVVAPPPEPEVDEAQLETERLAREKAELEAAAERDRAEEARLAAAAERDRAEEARLAAEKAQADVARAQAEAAKAQADAERAQAEAAKAVAEAERAKAEAERSSAEAEAAAAAERARTAALIPLNEQDLGWGQKRMIQEKLRLLGHYRGPIDAIMGPLTREAIQALQRERGEPVTGYLTVEQYQALLTTTE